MIHFLHMTTSYRVQDSTNIHKRYAPWIYWDFWLQKGDNSASTSWNVEVNLWIMLQENSEIDMTSGTLSFSPAGQEPGQAPSFSPSKFWLCFVKVESFFFSPGPHFVVTKMVANNSEASFFRFIFWQKSGSLFT